MSYTYDAWGNFTSQTENGIDDPISYLNPFTYRGYYYDDGLGLYYLNSRYYDAKVGRFISADDIGYLGANGDLNSYNLYAYCSNNPVSFSDSSGNFPFHLLIGAAIGGIMGGVSAALSGEDLWGIILGTAGGIASGLLTASGFGVVGQVIGSTAISMSTNALTQFKNIISDETGETTFDYADMLFDGVVAGAFAIVGGKGASYKNAGGINAAWKQLFKKGISDPKARSYFVKTAHNAGKKFVLKSLFESLGINSVGTAVITGKNYIRRLINGI